MSCVKKLTYLRIEVGANIVKPTQTRINREKYTFCVIKSLKLLKNLETRRVPYLGLELTMNVPKSQIHHSWDSPFKGMYWPHPPGLVARCAQGWYANIII